MLKIPTFVIGSLLVLTGLAGYLFQDLGLSIKLTGPLADDATFVLSDGEEKHELDFIPVPESAGENAWWIIHKLNEEHAGVASQGNYFANESSKPNDIKSFWYASSKGETLEGLLKESEKYKYAGSGEIISVDWTSIDVNRSTIRFVYNNAASNPGPVTLQSNNWTNVELNPPLKPNDKLTFKKSWTAFIPGIIGILLIFLAQAAEVIPKARKHIMHLAVLIGLLCFFIVAGKVGGAVNEMQWLKAEPYGIVHASMLKSVSMLLSAGLLLIFVILCIISFVQARMQKTKHEKLESEKEMKKAVAEAKKKAHAKKQESSEDKDNESSKNDPKSKEDKNASDTKDDKGSDQNQGNRKPSDENSTEDKDDSKDDINPDKIDERLEKKREMKDGDSKKKDSKDTLDGKSKDSNENEKEDDSEKDESSKNSSS